MLIASHHIWIIKKFWWLSLQHHLKFTSCTYFHPHCTLLHPLTVQASKKSPRSPLPFKWISTLDGKQTLHTNSSWAERRLLEVSQEIHRQWEGKRTSLREMLRSRYSEVMVQDELGQDAKLPLLDLDTSVAWPPWGVLGFGLHWAPGLATSASAGINLPCPRSLSHWNWICSGWWNTQVRPWAVRVGKRDFRPVQLLEGERVGKVSHLGSSGVIPWWGNSPNTGRRLRGSSAENNNVRTTNTYIPFPHKA